MVSRLRPLEVNLVFDDRLYKLGETIDLVVELTARGDVEVREGRVDLVCDARYTERYTVMAAERIPGPDRAPGTRFSVPRQITKEHKETYVHSSVVFTTDARLASGTRQYRAQLEIGPESPAEGHQPTVKWTLVAAIDVTRARDVKSRQRVKVTTD